jgi:hypothetical protein
MTLYRVRRRCRFNEISCYMSVAYPMQTLITEEARNVFELGLPGGTDNGPARPVPFYGRFVLFRPLPSEGVIGGICVGAVIYPGTAWPWHCDHIGPHEQRAAIANLLE